MLHIFFGRDSFSIREALQELKSTLDGDGMLQASTIVYDARQVTPQEVIAACDTLPFLSSHRLVIVEGLLQLATEPAGRGGPRGGSARRRPSQAGGAQTGARPGAGPWQALVDYVDRMPPSTTLLLLLDGDVPPGGPFLDALSGKGRLRHFRPLDRRALPAWIQHRAQGLAMRIDGRAVKLLADLVGNNLWILTSELDKLAAYAAGQPVGEEDVRALVSAAQEVRVFSLVDAIVEGRPQAAVRLLREMLAQGQASAYVFAMIQRQYRHLAIAREMLDTGSTARSIGERLGVPGYGLDRLLEQASRYPLRRVRAAFRRLLETDVAIKRGIYDEELALELLVQGLAAQPAPSPAG